MQEVKIRVWRRDQEVQSIHLNTILWGEVPQFNEQDGEVVDEEQGVYEREGELDNVLVMELVSLLQEMDAVKQPETKDEDEDEGGDEGAEDKDTRESGGGVAKENCPRSKKKDEELEGEADEHPITGNVALQVGGLHLKDTKLWKSNHEDWTKEGCQSQEKRGGRPKVLTTSGQDTKVTLIVQQYISPELKAFSALYLPLAQVLHGVVQLGGSRHCGGRLAPVLVLKIKYEV